MINVEAYKRDTLLKNLKGSNYVLEMLKGHIHVMMREGPNSISMEFHGLLNTLELASMQLESIEAKLDAPR